MKKPRYKIAVAGSVERPENFDAICKKAKVLGKAIAKKGHFLVTGSHHGFPFFSALGAKEEGGDVIYFSPAGDLKEHSEIYRLDSDNADMIVYTGFGHAGSNIMLARSADAVIIGFGNPDALHEFDLALRAGKPVGVLRGDFEIDEALEKLGSASHKPVVFEDDPDKLVDKLIEMVLKQ